MREKHKAGGYGDNNRQYEQSHTHLFKNP